jgi:hypothetical protein
MKPKKSQIEIPGMVSISDFAIYRSQLTPGFGGLARNTAKK